MEFNKNELVKSPLNYTGGKFKLLPQILPLFPDNIDTFYDVFGGGCNIGVNLINTKEVLYNDIVNYIVNMFKELKSEPNIELCLIKIHKVIDKYKLCPQNAEGFLELRKDYNKGNKTWDMFYVLVVNSFNNQFRFNNKHEYNSSFGKELSYYKKDTELRFIKFFERLHNTNIKFSCEDFRDIDFSDADKNDLIYFDPPYLITTGNYNDGKRGFKGWNEQDERDLLELCDKLHKKGTRFALSNVFECKGKSNDILKEWSKKYNVHYINSNYGNSNYNAKDKSKDSTIEVLITNYRC